MATKSDSSMEISIILWIGSETGLGIGLQIGLEIGFGIGTGNGLVTGLRIVIYI